VKVDFEESGLQTDEYCRKKGLNVRWFEKQKREAEIYEGKHINNSSNNSSSGLFVELEPEDEQIPHFDLNDSAPGLKLTYREVVFDLPHNFEETTFKRALQAVQEAL
jgi:hypothetical protein